MKPDKSTSYSLYVYDFRANHLELDNHSRESSLGTINSLVACSSLSMDSVRFPTLHISMTAGVASFRSFLGSHIVEVSWV